VVRYAGTTPRRDDQKGGTTRIWGGRYLTRGRSKKIFGKRNLKVMKAIISVEVINSGKKPAEG